VHNDDDNALAATTQSGAPAGQVITLAGAVLDTNDTYVGGRMRNTTLTPDEWMTIVAHDATTVTVDPYEDLTNWVDTNDIEIYTAAENAGIIYDIPITGATITLENNFTYLTPEELAIVNQPLAGFAGSRAVSGSLTAYLNTGAQGSGGLLADMLSKIESSVSNSYDLVFKMGGASGRRVEFNLPTCQLSVPTTNVEDIISTEISFVSKPTSAGIGSFEATNELVISYYD